METRKTTSEEINVIETTFESVDLKTKKAWNKSVKQAALFNSAAIAINNIRKQSGLSHH